MSGTTALRRMELLTEDSASSGVTRIAGGGLSPIRCNAASTSARSAFRSRRLARTLSASRPVAVSRTSRSSTSAASFFSVFAAWMIAVLSEARSLRIRSTSCCNSSLRFAETACSRRTPLSCSAFFSRLIAKLSAAPSCPSAGPPARSAISRAAKERERRIGRRFDESLAVCQSDCIQAGPQWNRRSRQEHVSRGGKGGRTVSSRPCKAVPPA